MGKGYYGGGLEEGTMCNVKFALMWSRGRGEVINSQVKWVLQA
jgi:hypothetical protein